MQIEYNLKENFAAARPPVEPGRYAVLRKDGKIQEAVWDGEEWKGIFEVVRYSGTPALLSTDVRKQHRQNIRAGLEVPEGHTPRAIAQKCAMELARDRAVRMAMAESRDVPLPTVKSMVGLFMVARTLGVSFLNESTTPASLTDKALFAWGMQQIREDDPGWFDRMEIKVKSLDGIRSWLDQR